MGSYEDVQAVETVVEEDTNCKCGEESTRGCHVIKDGVVLTEYQCDKCYNKKDTA